MFVRLGCCPQENPRVDFGILFIGVFYLRGTMEVGIQLERIKYLLGWIVPSLGGNYLASSLQFYHN